MTNEFEGSADISSIVEDKYLYNMQKYFTMLTHSYPPKLLMKETEEIPDFKDHLGLEWDNFREQHYGDKNGSLLIALLHNEFEPHFGYKRHPTYFRNIHKFNTLQKDLLQRYRQKLFQEFLSYIRQINLFTKEHAADLALFAKKLIAEIYTSKNQILKASHLSFDHSYVIEDSIQMPDLDIERSIMLERFVNDLETEANKSYKLSPGIFRFSKPYYDTLNILFPTLSNPFREVTKGLNEKDEL